jgi:hypothetical protein
MPVISVHLARDAETGVVDPDAPVLIIGPDRSRQTGRLLPGELALFAGDSFAYFEAEFVDGVWRLIRRAGTN